MLAWSGGRNVGVDVPSMFSAIQEEREGIGDTEEDAEGEPTTSHSMWR